MAAGRLGSVDLGVATDATVFTVTTGKVASFSVSFCNRNATAVLVRLSLCDTSTPGVDEYIEYNTSIPGYGVLERSKLVLGNSMLVVARSDTANVSVVAYGYEDAA